MTYKWKSGSRYANGLAQTAGEICASLEEKGMLTPSHLVNVSRPEDAPLHKCFEWDDRTAAEAYRKNQAMHIIRSIEVVTEDTEGKEASQMSCFYHIELDDVEPHYEHINTIIKNEDKYQSLLASAKKEMTVFCNKYREIEALKKVRDAMGEAIEEIDEEAS